MSYYIAIAHFPDGDVLPIEVASSSRPTAYQLYLSWRKLWENPPTLRCILSEKEYAELPF